MSRCRAPSCGRSSARLPRPSARRRTPRSERESERESERAAPMTAAAKSVVELVALMGVQASVLALLAFAVVRAGRLRPGWQASVWLVVLVKFVLPWGPALPWSLANLLAALSHHGGGGGNASVAAAAGPAVAPHVSAVWSMTAGFWLTGAAIVLARALIAQHRVVQAARRAPLAP